MFVYCENPIRLNNDNYIRYMPKSNPYIEVPCGRCILCRLKMRKEWTLRLRLEASLYKESCFVTLTYDEEHVPPEVYVRDIQLFVKRLRKNSKLKFRYYSVAEYGSRTERPHFHIILFGYPLKLLEYIKKSWKLGFSSISPLTQERCNYTCGYTQKKYDKKDDKSLYSLFPHLTYNERMQLYLFCGDLLREKYHKDIDPRRAEFATCSLGIGKGFLEKNLSKIKEDYCIHFGGKKFSIPRYFRKQIELDDEDWIEDWKKHVEEFASEKLIGLFDKSSNEYIEQSFEFGDFTVKTDYVDYVEELWEDYVKHKANTIKRKRELFKKIKENKEI